MIGPATPSALGKRAFWFMVIGTALNLLAIVAWTAIGPPMPGSDARLWAMMAAVVLQGGALACLLTALIVGILALVRKSRPVVWPLLALLGIPIAFVTAIIELVLVRLLLGL